MPSTRSPRCCWNARTAWSRSSSKASSATCLPVLTSSSSGLTIQPSADNAARISVTAPSRSPRRSIDIKPGLSVTSAASGTAWTVAAQATRIVADARENTENSRPIKSSRLEWTRRSDVVSELAQQRGLALRPDDALHRRAVLEQDQGGDRHHLEVTRGARVGVHVELGDGELAGLLGGRLIIK